MTNLSPQKKKNRSDKFHIKVKALMYELQRMSHHQNIISDSSENKR